MADKRTPPAAGPSTVKNAALYQRQQSTKMAQIPSTSQPTRHGALLPSEPPQQQPPTPHDPILFQQVVSLLSSTANGCITELGYPAICTHLNKLEIAYNDLLKRHKDLEAYAERFKVDNFRMAQMLDNKRKREAAGQAREQSDAHVIEALKARITQLEQEQDLLRRQHAVLQQTQAMSATDAYRILDGKYRYVLDMLKRHHTPVLLQNQDGRIEARLIPQIVANEVSFTDVVDLTNSPQGGVLHNNANASLPAQRPMPNGLVHQPQPGMQSTSSPTVPLQSGQATFRTPSVTVPSSSTTVVPSLTRGEASLPTPVTAGSQTPPITSSLMLQGAGFPPSSTLPTALPNWMGQTDTGGLIGSSNPDLQTPKSAIESPRAPNQGHDIGVLARSITRALQPQPMTQHIRLHAQPESRPSSVPRVTVQSSIAIPSVDAATQAQPRTRVASQSQPQPQSLSATPAPLISDTTRTPASAMTQVRPEMRPSSPTPIPGPFAPPAAQSEPGSSSRSSLLAPSPTIAAQAQAEPRPPSHSVPPSSDVTQVQQDVQPMLRLASSAPQTPITIHTHPLSQAQSYPQSHAPTPAPTSVPTAAQHAQEAQAMDADPAEVTPISGSQDIDVVMKDEAVTAEDDEEEEDWGDLTDDESAQKRPVVDCISSVFYDDEDDERFCQLCNTRIQTLNLPDPRPIFSESSMRDLIVHVKNEHPIAWEKLRKVGETQA